MGINIRIVSESGKELGCLLDPKNLTKRLLPDVSDNRFHCLRFIDPYGDTVFTRYQLPVLITEIEIMLKRVDDEKVRVHGTAIVELACRALNDIHQYLKFIGD
jgi:hypothetical protein